MNVVTVLFKDGEVVERRMGAIPREAIEGMFVDL